MSYGMHDDDWAVRLARTSGKDRVLLLEEHVAWTAQTVHNAYHDHPGSWRDCPKGTCDAARKILGLEAR